ncbi:MAG: polysaccharide deacetylase family protein [Planctomycetota bacterium]
MPDLLAFLTGNMPYFIYQSKGTDFKYSEIPVFVFHQVVPEYLEKQLLYLKSNGYRTLTADALEEAVCGRTKGNRSVAITFDDATWTFWAYAFPLLQKYKFQAILFVSPGIIPEGLIKYPNLNDVWQDACTLSDVSKRGNIQPLCTWRELEIMHKSGNVDIQSHSLSHSYVPVSRCLVDFLHPNFDVGTFGNVKIPVSSLDDPKLPERKLRLGAPLFKSIPRMACKRRFVENPELINSMINYVVEHGGKEFFDRPGWRIELKRFFKKWPADRLGSFETQEEMESAVSWELIESKRLLEEKLFSRKIRHFCYPWFMGSEVADRLAADAGYHTVHYGIKTPKRSTQKTNRPIRIRRISEEYLFRLPGDGRQSLRSVWINKARRSGNLKS